MKVKELQALLVNLNPEMDVFACDPDRSSIIWAIDVGHVEVVENKKQFAASEFDSHDFPIGFEFFKLS